MTPDRRAAAQVGVAAPDRLGRIRLPDGRGLGWAEWGPADGLPVLLCPGGATSRWLGFGAHLVDGLGIRLVSIDRPGLGASDPAPGRTLADWPEDVAALAAARGLERPRVVGYSQGAPFALACAASGIAAGVSVVSGGGEPAAPELADALAPQVRSMVAAVLADPERAERALAASADADAMWNMVTAGCAAADRAVFRQPSFASAYRRALSEGFAQGPAGYARDTVLTMGHWPFSLADIDVPVDLWYGERDTSMFHSPAMSDTLAGAIPTARCRIVPEAGGLLLWTHAEPILRSLLCRTATG